MGTTSDAGTEFDPFDPINIATKKLYDRRIVTVFSAGTKQAKLAEFSSRGVNGKGGTVMIDGEIFKWEDRPTVTAP
jgi:serine protease AprX